MNHKSILFFCLIVIFSSCSRNKEDKLKVTFIEQSGVFVESGNKKVLMDALFQGHPEWPYPAPSPGLLDSMESAKEPFDKIDLFLVTHSHVDHGNPNSLEKGLKSNPNAVLITTPVMAQSLNRHCDDYKSIENQVFAPDISPGEMMDTIIRGVNVHIAHLKHMNGLHWPDTVYSFLIDINGKRVLNNAGSIGYFPKEYENIRYDTMNIDVAILYHNFLSHAFLPDTSFSGKFVLDNFIKPENILLGHRNFHTKEFMENLRKKFSEEYPNLDILINPLESWEY